MKLATISVAVALTLLSGVAYADDEMYKTKNCFACHRIERNHLGPSFKAIAAKYAAEKDVDVKFAKKIREGTVGAWGQVPMPAQTQVTEEEALTLARWILEQK